MRRLALVASLALAVAPAAVRAQSPIWGSFELGAGRYRPDIDAQPGLGQPLPFGDIFGTGRGWAFRAGISKAILKSPGSLEVGFRTGYFRESGKSLEIVNGQITDTKSGDTTTFNIIPTSLTLT
ncbi:MAG TPA: hypothetical protein VFK90_00490, partial [Anaeromyxobacter sp.]|nr:hypothetical protein [Anaeromyxobacter sp.]